MHLIRKAVHLLRAGGLVAFPTETVYGLGADATNSAAVRKVFDVKGRPSTNPLIVHVADKDVARRYATDWPESAELLARTFWPGALTLILPKHSSIVDEATAGRKTVGLRVPDHPLTRQLLHAFDGPLVGPSANRSMRVSPTTAGHVRQELGDWVDMILDGGACRVGIESTVVDLMSARPAILRPGGVSRQDIERIIGPTELIQASVCPTAVSSSPGQHPVHYSPITPAYWYNPRDDKNLIASLEKRDPRRLTVVSIASVPQIIAIRWIAMPCEPVEYARRLYSALRDADEAQGDAILIEMPPDEPCWLAVRDRLHRASRPLAQRVE